MPVDAFIYFEEQAGMLALDGDVDGRDFLVWQRGSSAQELHGISENIHQSGTQYPTAVDDTDLSYSVEILGTPATFAEYGILLAI